MAPKRKLAAATAKAAALQALWAVLFLTLFFVANSGFMLRGLPCVCVAR